MCFLVDVIRGSLLTLRYFRSVLPTLVDARGDEFTGIDLVLLQPTSYPSLST